jgi:hypothetical protein
MFKNPYFTSLSVNAANWGNFLTLKIFGAHEHIMRPKCSLCMLQPKAYIWGHEPPHPTPPHPTPLHFTSAPSSVLPMVCRWNVYPCPCSVNGDNNVMNFASSKHCVALTWVRRDADGEICELSCPKELTTVEMDKWRVVWKLQTCWSQQCDLTCYLHHDTSSWMVNYYVKLLRKPCRQILIHFLIPTNYIYIF